MSYTLGIDASTTTAGFAVVERSTNKIIDVGFLDISKKVKHKEKARHFIDTINQKSWIKKIDKINVEAPLSGFAKGKTSQQVIILLARFSAVFCYIVEEHYNIEVNLVNATTMRKNLFGVSRIKGVPPKEFVLAQIDARFDMKPWNKINKVGNVDVRMADARDALVAAFY